MQQGVDTIPPNAYKIGENVLRESLFVGRDRYKQVPSLYVGQVNQVEGRLRIPLNEQEVASSGPYEILTKAGYTWTNNQKK